MRELVVGGRYRHFKGNYYRVEGTARDSETGETLVLYRSEKEGGLWARPLCMFLSEVDREKYPEADQTYRFEYLGERRQ